MELKLRIDGKEKTFVCDFVSGRMFRRAFEVRKLLLEGEVDEQKVDKLIDYVVDVFGKQFTRDEFYDGIEARKIISTVTETISFVVGNVGTEDDSPNQ